MNKTTKGFTLMELLVVISIIALLMSILMPSLQKVKAQARRVVCGSNQRQMAIAAIMYAEDFNGKFARRGQYSPMDSFAYWNAAEQGGPYAVSSDMRYMWNGYMAGYRVEELGVSSPRDYAPKVMFCPSAKNTFLGYGKTWPTPMWGGYFLLGYAFFNLGDVANVSGTSWWVSNRKMPEKSSSRGSTPLIGDILMYQDDYSMFRMANHTKHDKADEWFYEDPQGANNAHVDGSVKWYRYSEMERMWGNRWNQYTCWGKSN